MAATHAGRQAFFFYTFTGEYYPAYEPNLRYAACQNRPEWRYWTEKVVQKVARCGVDGVFVDNAGSLAKARVNAFRQPGKSRYVLHLVNYNVPLGVAAREPEVQRGLVVALRLPEITMAPQVRCCDPQGPAAGLPAEVQDGQVRFTLPELRISKVLEIE